MTSAEYREWWTTHTGYYPGIDSWLSSLSEERAEAVHRAGYSLMRDVLLADAIAATEILARRKDQPRGYGDHSRIIMQLASELRADRERQVARPVSGCSYCRGSGYVSIYAGGSPWERQYVQAYGEAGRLRDIAVACVCPAAQHTRGPQYNPRGMVKYRGQVVAAIPEDERERVLGLHKVTA